METTPSGGSSAGAIVCAVIDVETSMEDSLDATKTLADDCRLRGSAFRLGTVLRDVLDVVLPDDIHMKWNGRVGVGTYYFKDMENSVSSTTLQAKISRLIRRYLIAQKRNQRPELTPHICKLNILLRRCKIAQRKSKAVNRKHKPVDESETQPPAIPPKKQRKYANNDACNFTATPSKQLTPPPEIVNSPSRLQSKTRRFIRRCLIAQKTTQGLQVTPQVCWQKRLTRRFIIARKKHKAIRHNGQTVAKPLTRSHKQKRKCGSGEIGCLPTNYVPDFRRLKRRRSNQGECNYKATIQSTPSTTIPEVSTRRRRFLEPWNFGAPTETCQFCNAVMWIEESVGKCHPNERPKFSLCCQKGKVRLPLLKDPPEYLKSLTDPNGGPRSTEFLRLIRAYNSIFAFTSMGGKVDNSINNGTTPYCFRLNGQNHHKIGSILPPEGKQPRFMQLYFYDNDQEVQERINSLNARGKNSLDPDIVQGLTNMMYEHNNIAKMCKMAKERIDPTNLQPVQLRIIGSRKKDARQYNLPTSDEIAALIVGSGQQGANERDIIIYDRALGLKRIPESHPSLMAMQYPLMFPYGEDGFTPNIKHCDAETSNREKKNCVTIREYYAYRFQERRKDGKIIDGISPLCGKLRQQFMVDSFTCVEETRLDYIRHHQKDIRKHSLRGLIDGVAAGETAPASLGQRYILPPSFPGCYRNLFQNYQDALAICRWAGPPDLFITFTANPKWTEVKEFLAAHPKQRLEGRAEIVTRVFKIKLDQLMSDITRNEFFGKVIAVVYTIEFQKRGWPHVHICLFLHPEHKHVDPSDIDNIISAELPDKKNDPVRFHDVTQFMIHGPCGHMNNQSQCMVDGKCSKYYPRPFRAQTSVTEDGYPEYRRRVDGRTVEKNGCTLDNRSAVPHNIDLLVKYQSHINVEWCNKHRSIKYLFKYMSKGPDMALASIQEQQNDNSGVHFPKPSDEIDTYLRCRYVSASEASWRIFAFEIQYKHPPVQRLCFHLEEELQVTFEDSEHPEEVLDKVGLAEQH